MCAMSWFDLDLIVYLAVTVVKILQCSNFLVDLVLTSKLILYLLVLLTQSLYVLVCMPDHRTSDYYNQ